MSERVTVRFDELEAKVSEMTDFPVHINVIPPRESSDIDWKTRIMRFSQDLILHFEKDVTYKCGKIVTADGSLECHNLKLIGWLESFRSDLTLIECEISGMGVNSDYLISVSGPCSLALTNCRLEGGWLFGLGLHDGVRCKLKGTVIEKCGESIVCIFDSNCKIQDCELRTCKTDIITADSAQAIVVKRTILSDSKHSGINILDCDFVTISDCQFERNCRGALTAHCCRETRVTNSTISDSEDTAILLDDTRIMLSNVTVKKCDGNGVNCQKNCRVQIENCRFSDGKWPLAAFCDGTEAHLTHSVLEFSEMNGFVVRGDSKVSVSDCVIRCCVEDGLRISDSRSVVLERCTFMDCGSNAIELCDYSKAIVRDCTVSGSFMSAINVYAGASIVCRNLSVIGPMDCAIWIRLGGSAQLANILIDGTVDKSLKFDVISTIVGQNKMRSLMDKRAPVVDIMPSESPIHPLIKVDSKWSVVLTGCYIVGFGWYELMSNVSKNRVDISPANNVPAKCLGCEKPATSCFFSPCGHCVYCETCWAAADPKVTKCPICRLPIQSTTRGVYCDGDVCWICYTNVVDSILLPCGHLICRECSVMWMKDAHECPFCRTPSVIRRRLVTYE